MMKIVVVLNPLILAAYAVLAILAHNPGEVLFPGVERALIISVSGALLLVLAFFAILKDWVKAGLIAGMMTILFFSYGHFYTLVDTTEVGGLDLGRHSLLLPLWGMMFGAWTWWVLRKMLDARSAVNFFSTFSLILILFPVLRMVRNQYRAGSPAQISPKRYGMPSSPSTWRPARANGAGPI